MDTFTLRKGVLLLAAIALLPALAHGQYPLIEVRAWLYDTGNTPDRSDDQVVAPYESGGDYYVETGINATQGFDYPARLNFGNKIWDVYSDASTVYRLVFQIQCDNSNLIYECGAGGRGFWMLRKTDCYWFWSDIAARKDLILTTSYNDGGADPDLITDYERGWWSDPTNIGHSNAPDPTKDITRMDWWASWSMLDCVDPPGPGARNWQDDAYDGYNTLYAGTDSTIIWEIHFIVDNDWTDNESINLQLHMNPGKDGHSTDIYFVIQTRNRVVKWIYPEYAAISSVVSSPVIRDGRVYIGSDEANLYCLDASDGSQIWTYTAGDRIRSSPAAAYESGYWVMYFGCDDGSLYAVRDLGSSPELKWSVQLQNPLTSSPALWNDLVFVGSGDSLQCRFTSDGSTYWAQDLSGPVTSSPAVFWDNMVWIGSDSDYLYKFSIDGTPLGSYPVCGDIVAPVWMAYWDGRVSIGSYASATPGDDTLYVIDNIMMSGSKFHDDGNLARTYTSCFSLNDTTVYFGNDNNCVYCIDIGASGSAPTLIYKYDTGDDVHSSPLYWDGVVYFGSNSDRFYALDDQTQQPRANWPFVANGDIQSSPAISIPDSVVVVGSMDGHIYGFHME